MLLTSDYHTHTIFSHGKGTIADNAAAASKTGLKELGISDHGFAHPVFGLTAKKLPEMKKLCESASKEFGIKVLLGIESNIIGTKGITDLKPEYYDYFDIYLAGIHKFVMYKLDSVFPLAVPNLYFSTLKKFTPPKSLSKENTKTFINVIKNNPIDVITHLNFCCFADAVEVAKCARDYGTYVELNSKKVHLSDEELYQVAQTGVKFVIDSDAHTPQRVGEFSLVEKMLDRVNIKHENIENIDGRLPDFRFKRFKEKGEK